MKVKLIIHLLNCQVLDAAFPEEFIQEGTERIGFWQVFKVSNEDSKCFNEIATQELFKRVLKDGFEDIDTCERFELFA